MEMIERIIAIGKVKYPKIRIVLSMAIQLYFLPYLEGGIFISVL